MSKINKEQALETLIKMCSDVQEIKNSAEHEDFWYFEYSDKNNNIHMCRLFDEEL